LGGAEILVSGLFKRLEVEKILDDQTTLGVVAIEQLRVELNAIQRPVFVFHDVCGVDRPVSCQYVEFLRNFPHVEFMFGEDRENSAEVLKNRIGFPSPDLHPAVERFIKETDASSKGKRQNLMAPADPEDRAARFADQIDLAVSEPAWLERLLVGLGRDATVVAPPELVNLGATAAARLRARYDAT